MFPYQSDPTSLLRDNLMSNNQNTTNWPELAIGLYDKLTGRGAEISYAFDNLEFHVPSSTLVDAERAHWKMIGTLRISTKSLDEPQ